jgi:ketosteroid isomerase-like protein
LRTRRSLDERLFVRWPRVWPALAGTLFLLPPRSRLRRALLRRATLSGWSAWSRWDFDLMLVRYAPDFQSEQAPEFVAVGMSSCYHGHAGAREWAADLREAWERVDITPVQTVDAGDRIVILGHAHTRARRSGVELESPSGQVLWFEGGLIARERWFFNWDAALRAAGVPTHTFADLGLASEHDPADSV